MKFIDLDILGVFLTINSDFDRCFVVEFELLKATTIAAFARMTVEDSRKIFTPEQYPPWVVFSNQQKVNFYFDLIF